MRFLVKIYNKTVAFLKNPVTICLLLGLFLSIRLWYNELSFSATATFFLDTGWRFSRDDDTLLYSLAQPGFDDTRWQKLSIPHDWAIYGPFSQENDKQVVAIEQDGQTDTFTHIGRTGGLPFTGVGWYRRRIFLNNPQDKQIILQLDGAMSHASVYLNGVKAGFWPNGYNTFYLDITENVVSGTNTLAVRLENLTEQSRWYPGAGLYRNVHLIIKPYTNIKHWGTFITTPRIEKSFAEIHIKTEITNSDHIPPENILLLTKVYDSRGALAGKVSDRFNKLDSCRQQQSLLVAHPQLWSPDSPNLYIAHSYLYVKGKLRDKQITRFGIRSIALVPGKGFFLNGKKTMFQGVCLHHDLGPLGAAVNKAAIRRQIRQLKSMGANAIRTAHNMPAPEFIQACDEMGMMVVAESFDEWKEPKMKNGYHHFFDAWAEKDLVNLIRHYRNSPSVVMWCIGNEVPEQGAPGGAKTARFLQDICRREDPTRPVTQGMDQPGSVINNNFAATMEVVGINYRPYKYTEGYQKLQQQIILGTETASTLSARGVYKFPVVRKSMAKYPDHQASSYDVEHCSWSDLPEDNFIVQEDSFYTIGEFVWTGYDYLGEPTPYYSDWPSHSSLFGIIDLAGIPKDRYYLYKSHWNKSDTTLHILPHWTWPGREGDTIPVFVYTNFPSAELFINGKSYGIQTKDTSIHEHNSSDSISNQTLKRQRRYRLMWLNTRYEPGHIKVIAFDASGRIAAADSLSTAGTAHHLQLKSDRTHLIADGKDLAFITISVVDKDGNLCPREERNISVSVKGQGQFKAMANGNAASLESFQKPMMHTFGGKLVAIVQSLPSEGRISIEARALGLPEASSEIPTRNTDVPLFEPFTNY